jgi:hypothetical protein
VQRQSHIGFDDVDFLTAEANRDLQDGSLGVGQLASVHMKLIQIAL